MQEIFFITTLHLQQSKGVLVQYDIDTFKCIHTTYRF